MSDWLPCPYAAMLISISTVIAAAAKHCRVG